MTFARIWTHLDGLLLALDLVGTFVFALSGAIAGVRHRVDLFGVLVLSFIAATAGGMTRDVLIGAVPPAALTDWRYLAVAMLAGVVTFLWRGDVSRVRSAVLTVDAVGLAMFAVSGAQKALVYGLEPVMAALLGMLTAIGGGMVRDVLLAEIPAVLRTDIYATAALAGASVVVAGQVASLPATPVAIAGAALCFGLRMLSIRRQWQLPAAVLREGRVDAATDTAVSTGTATQENGDQAER